MNRVALSAARIGRRAARITLFESRVWWPRFAIGFALLFAPFLRSAEAIPPPPRDHFNDYAGMVRRETAAQLNRELAEFERASSSQILVAIFPRLESGSSVEDYTVRVAESWRVGQKARDNGAVLFVFQQSRDIRIATGYGLEASLPDALCKQIIENEIVPRFRAGDFDGGLIAGVRAMMAATRNEYQGSGKTAAGSNRKSGGGLFVFVVIVVFILLAQRGASRRRAIYGRGGRRTVWLGPGSGGGGLGGGGGGTFSGGGGSFGGGGAGGRW